MTTTNRYRQITSLFILITFLISSTPASFVLADTSEEQTQNDVSAEGAAENEEEQADPELEPNENDGSDEPSEIDESDTDEEDDLSQYTNTQDQEEDDPKNNGDLTPPLNEPTSEGTTEEDNNTETVQVQSTNTTGGINNTAADNTEAEESTEVTQENAEEPLEETAEETNSNQYIETGVSYAALNLVNILNSNIVNSNGLILFLTNLFNTQKQQLDLRDYGFLSDSEGNYQCGEMVCGSDHLTINNNNDGHIVNDVYVGATSGDNRIDTDGDGIIDTGDAYASANVINIANTNIVDSDYLILTFSSFGDWNGDVVFPGAESLAALFGGGTNYNNVDIENDSEAVVVNSTDVSANSGDNTANSNSGESSINTGNASASTGVLNKINSNIFGSGNFSVIFRVHGDWIGDIFSLPEGVTYEKNSAGLTLLNLTGSFDSPIDSLVTDSVVIKNNNNAHIENNLIVTAVSGENSIEAEGDAIINTGNAYASANITNIANTNIVGKNWILAIIDIFGNWNGNISFGRPDLWIGEQITTDGKVTNGSTIDYTFTLMNNGDTRATNLVVTDRIDDRYVKFLNSPQGATANGDTITWNIDSLEPGEVREITYRARVENLPYGETEITNNVSVRAHEPDENDSDNSDTASFVAYVRPPSRKSQILDTQVLSSTLPMVSIESTNNAPIVVTEETEVTYKIQLTNNSTFTVNNVVLTDRLTKPNREIIHTEVFEIGQIEPGEVVIAEYTVLYTDAFETGIYTNYASATYEDHDGEGASTGQSSSRVNFVRPTSLTQSEITVDPEIRSGQRGIERQAPALRIVPFAEAAFGDTHTIQDDSELLATVARFRTHAAFGSAMAIILLLIAYELSRRSERRR